MRSLLIAMVGLALVVQPSTAAAQTCEKLSPGTCPQIYRIWTGGQSGTGLDLLIVPAGFPEKDLDHFRCAATKLLAGLLEMELFRDYACRLNIYRMDIASPASGEIKSQKGCTGCKADPVAPYEDWKCDRITHGVPVGQGTPPACSIQDLEARFCGNGKTCELLIPTPAGQEQVLDLRGCLARVTGRIPTVLVLANSGSYGGGVPTSGGMAVSALPYLGEEKREPGITRRLWRLIGHELGHAMLLLHDEYTRTEATRCDLRPGMNIVQASDIKAGAWPWKGDCNPRPCQKVCSSGTGCAYGKACRNGQPCCTDGGALIPDFVGLVEGACYNECGYYRASNECLMDDLDHPFCAGCLAATKARLARLGIPACADEKPDTALMQPGGTDGVRDGPGSHLGPPGRLRDDP